MTQQNITFIGGGNMAASLVGGLVANGKAPAEICVSDIDPSQCRSAEERFGVTTSDDNAAAVANADIVVLAVKPQVMVPVIGSLAEAAKATNPLMVSVAAGVRAADISRWLGYPAAVVRTMPNTPALVGAGATALFANDQVTPEQRVSAKAILDAVGISVWVDSETQLDAVTALSGSGPAYYFLLMELMQAAGEKLGLDPDTARQLTLQTALGAARIANEGEDSPGTLREKVTSPNGTTEQALLFFQNNGMAELVAGALQAAHDRSVELGDELGKS